MTWALANLAESVRGLSACERLVLARYAQCDGEKDVVWPGLKYLCLTTGRSRGWIIKCRRKLEAEGLLILVSRGIGHIPSIYRCNRELIEQRAAIKMSGTLSEPLRYTHHTSEVHSVDPNLVMNLESNLPLSEVTAVSAATHVDNSIQVDSDSEDECRFEVGDDIRERVDTEYRHVLNCAKVCDMILDEADPADAMQIVYENVIGEDDEAWRLVNLRFVGRRWSDITAYGNGTHIIAAAREVQRYLEQKAETDKQPASLSTHTSTPPEMSVPRPEYDPTTSRTRHYTRAELDAINKRSV